MASCEYMNDAGINQIKSFLAVITLYGFKFFGREPIVTYLLLGKVNFYFKIIKTAIAFAFSVCATMKLLLGECA